MQTEKYIKGIIATERTVLKKTKNTTKSDNMHTRVAIK